MKIIVGALFLVGCVVIFGHAEVHSMINTILFQDKFLKPGHVLDHWRSILSIAAKQVGKEHLADIKRLVNISFNTEKALITGSINNIIKTQEAFLPIYKRLLPHLSKNKKYSILFHRIADCKKLIKKLKYQQGNLYDVAAFFKQSKLEFWRVLYMANK